MIFFLINEVSGRNTLQHYCLLFFQITLVTSCPAGLPKTNPGGGPVSPENKFKGLNYNGNIESIPLEQSQSGGLPSRMYKLPNQPPGPPMPGPIPGPIPGPMPGQMSGPMPGPVAEPQRLMSGPQVPSNGFQKGSARAKPGKLGDKNGKTKDKIIEKRFQLPDLSVLVQINRINSK